MNTARQIIDLAIKKRIRISTAESCTGGMVAAALTDITGSSAVFERGFVTYSNDAKTDMLGVSTATLAAYGAVSEEVAHEMAIGCQKVANTDLAVSITGIAGPGGSEHKPEGRVCFGLINGQEVRVETVDFGALGRLNVRISARQHALQMILDSIE